MSSLLSFRRHLIHRAYLAATKKAWAEFDHGCLHTSKVQENKLKDLLRINSQTEYGKKHHFSDIRSISDYQSKVPVVRYEDLDPWIVRAAAGDPNVLCAEPIVIFERTSGSSAANKLIPYTKGVLSEFSAAVTPWLHDTFRSYPSVRGKGSYWSLSPIVQRQEELTSGGFRIGFEDDTEYLSPVERWGWTILNSVPNSVAKAAEMAEWERQTSYYLLLDRNLGFMSIWSPTFAIRVMQGISRWLDDLLPELPPARAREIRFGLEREGRLSSRALWPNLALISSWTDGPSASFMHDLGEWFPGVSVQSKGLLATEGVVTISIAGEKGGVFAVNSHFVEFIDLDNESKPPLLPHELKVGGMYSPILSTSGGFYRYHLRDVVSCVGFRGSAPLLKFEGKYDQVSDLTGEKLNAVFVQKVLRDALNRHGVSQRFALLAPVRGPTLSYRLFIETDESAERLKDLVKSIDQALSEAHHYGYSRRMRQLGPVDFQVIRAGIEKFEKQMCAKGQRAGNIKPTSLGLGLDWQSVFTDTELNSCDGLQDFVRRSDEIQISP